MPPFFPFSVTLLALLGHLQIVVAGATINWGPCNNSVVQDPSLSCAFFDVPLDYHDPSAGNARLAVIKANATGERQGAVFLNPGGPGGSGLETVAENKDALLAVTGGVYDVISWDPRGVGNLTNPGEIYCFDDVEDYNALFNGTIEFTGIAETGNFTNPADVAELLAQAPSMQKKYEQLAQYCVKEHGENLKYLGTAAAVRDIVSMADAIDGPDAPINYFGISYGTLIGSWLVNMFPERVGRIILNGVLDPVQFSTLDPSITNQDVIVDSDMVYKGLITGCALAGPAGCALASEGDSPLDIDTKFQALLKAAYDAEKQHNGSVTLTSGQIRLTVFTSLYEASMWSNWTNTYIPQALQIIQEESGQNVSLKRNDNHFYGHHASHRIFKRQATAGPSYAGQAIYCADSIDTPPGTTMADVFNAIVDQTRNVAHFVGSMWPFTFYQCSTWPVRSVERYTGPFNKTLANKILIVSDKYDPVTPLAHAQRLAGLLGDSAALLIQNGFGHTSLFSPSTCTNTIMAVYMINGTLPQNNTVCEVDADFEVFSGVNTTDILANLPDVDI